MEAEEPQEVEVVVVQRVEELQLVSEALDLA